MQQYTAHLYTHTHTHNGNRKNKNKARKAVKENSSGAAGQPWTSFGLLRGEAKCSPAQWVQCDPEFPRALTYASQ